MKEERVFENKKYVYIEREKGEGLIVSMSTHNFGERYYMFHTLIEKCNCSLLFIKDPSNSYYLEHDQGASYQRLLRGFVNKYGCENITLFGSSMSGYGALFHSLELNVNAIVNNPQVDFYSSFHNAWPDLRKTLKKIESRWININDRMQFFNDAESNWFYAYGNARIDLDNVKEIRGILNSRVRFIFQNVRDNEHGFYFKNGRNVFLIHRLLSEMRQIRIFL